jgi:translation initiation factor 5A
MDSYVDEEGNTYYSSGDAEVVLGQEITYGEIAVGMKVLLKRKIEVTVTSVDVKETKRGSKVTVKGTDADGEEVSESKPEGRKTQQLTDVDGNAVGKTKSRKKKGGGGGGGAAKAAAGTGDYDVTSTVSGASLTVPIRAGEVKKGGFVMLKEKPCKVISVTTSKTGKHGHAKATITGTCIFTSAKCIDICPTSHNMTAPIITRAEYELTDLDREGAMTLMDGGGGVRGDLSVPRGQDGELNDVANEVKVAYAARAGEGQVWIQVVSAMGKEAAVAVRTTTG